MSASSEDAKKKLLAVGGKVSDLLVETAPELVVKMANEAKNKAKETKGEK